MTYENPQVPHEVNVSRESVVAEFLRLLAGLVAVLAVITALLYFGGGWLARFIPFSTERSWVGDAVIGVAIDDPGSTENRKVEKYLKSLVDRLASTMDLPPEMRLTVHYTEMEVPNAFATLGGHIIVTSELYQQMPSENALAMVLAHEIGHVRARDPIAALGGTASVAVLFALLRGEASGLTQQVGNVVMRGYSRQAEARADEAAIEALKALYGHAGGAAAVFEMFQRESQKSGMSMPSFLSTHPADQDRILRLKAAAGSWNPVRQPLRPLLVRSGA
jgi:Zn-dependent protease with chaperone function